MRHIYLLSTAILTAYGTLAAQTEVLTRPYIEMEEQATTVMQEIPSRNFEESAVPADSLLSSFDAVDSSELIQYQMPPGAPRLFRGYRHIEDVDFSHMIDWSFPGSAKDATPTWLARSKRAQRMLGDLEYEYILSHPYEKTYLSWELPEPPKLLDDDYSFAGFLNRLDIPEVTRQESIEVSANFEKTHWLHTTTDGIQFSQAYISPNWYQGGNSYLALLFNFYWNVKLNQVYHPNLMFESTLSYKLALNSVKDEYHKYSISQDLFQYNLKTGFKAFRSWFYSFNLQFKTQFLNNYESNSDIRKAGFLSPAELTAGLGMTYNRNFRNDKLKFSASIAPITYNLKTCIDPKIDPVQYGIEAGHKVANQIGSSAELTLDWDLMSNINWKARVFAFTDYSYFMGDWENTLTFTINRFLSTQIYTHLRFDSSSELRPGSKWKHWMLKEILSFGLTYTFSTI